MSGQSEAERLEGMWRDEPFEKFVARVCPAFSDLILANFVALQAQVEQATFRAEVNAASLQKTREREAALRKFILDEDYSEAAIDRALSE